MGFKEQASAVAQYLKVAKDLPPAGSFPPTGRATPDVSALGEGFQVIAGGQVQSVGGTSASTPTFASLVGLLNEARLKAGKPAMGHLNPFLYQNPDAFTDITVGTNAIDRGGQKVPYGYACAPGWVPATGLGTPKFGKMLTAAIKALMWTPRSLCELRVAISVFRWHMTNTSALWPCAAIPFFRTWPLSLNRQPLSRMAFAWPGQA